MGIFPQSLFQDILSSFKALRAPNEVGILLKSWLFDKSNKVYMLSLLVEIPCFDFFQFTINSLSSKESCASRLDPFELKSSSNLLMMGDGEFGGSLIIPTRLPNSLGISLVRFLFERSRI